MYIIKGSSKICFVLPSLKMGGLERVVLNLSNYFSLNKDIELHVISLTGNDDFYVLPDNVILHLPPKHDFNTINTIIYLSKYLRRVVKSINPNSCLSFGEMYNSFFLISTLGLNTKKFVSDRSQPNKNWGVFHNTLRQLIYRYADGVICQTQFSYDFTKYFVKPSKISIIPNPILVPPCISDISKKEKIILFVGRLIKSKNVSKLIEVFLGLNSKDWKLWIVGDGPEMDFIQKNLIHSGRTENIKIWGKQKDVSFFYNKASVFAFPSSSEGFPNAILEAMSFSLPIVSFNCIAGPSDLIQNGENGFLVDIGDYAMFKEKLEYLISSPNKIEEFSKKSSEFSKNFDISVIGKRYLEVLTNE